jgi:aspartate-semialdehyde dehydrogenase
MTTIDKKLRAGILGATGMVGQRFVQLLNGHPLFEISILASSARSAGRKYGELLEERKSWAMATPLPANIAEMEVHDAANVASVSAQCDFVFCAVDMPKEEVLKLEEAYARAETPVISNNSAARSVVDVPMMIPEVNADHSQVIDAQRKRLGTSRGFIAVKPNCSIQSYVPPLSALLDLGIEKVIVCTYQAISGAGKTFESWPEMVDNVIPFIGGEEAKSENEPLKVWGKLSDDKSTIINATSPVISAQCVRVPVADGHLAAVHVKFEKETTVEDIKARWAAYKGSVPDLDLPSAPETLVKYMEEDNRPQTRLDRDADKGMGVSVGRLRKDAILDFKFVCLSHNTLRGAAGGAVLSAELLLRKGYLQSRPTDEHVAKKARTEEE